MAEKSFYSFVREIFSEQEGVNIQNIDEKGRDYQSYFYNHLEMLPNFPNIEFISELSFQNYERKSCNVKLVFFPSQDFPTCTMLFKYKNQDLEFSNKNIRLVRKIVETSDDKNVLVLSLNQDVYCFKGIMKSNQIDLSFSDYYLVEINGYSDWSARCKNFTLFWVKNGYFRNYVSQNEVFKNEVKNIKKQFDALNWKRRNNFYKRSYALLKKMYFLGHGTSFIMFKNSKAAQNEAKRLCNANRGFLAEKGLDYSNLKSCVSQFSKVDGGFLLDRNFNCYAYGCIYDGLIIKPYSGSLAKGSRYNSTKLYVHYINSITSYKCVGVVISDDGGMTFVK